MSDHILSAREARLHAIQKAFGLDRSRVILSIKANIPGPNKRISEAYLLVRLFFNRVRSMIESSNHEFIDSDDGPYVLMIALGVDAVALKRSFVELEENHPLGPFIDLDVFDEPKASLSRVDLGYPLRTCYLCDRNAHDCIRNQRHDLKDLLKVVKSAVENHLMEETLKCINEAIIMELDLDEKFGLVTKSSSGSHEDMDYDLMVMAKDAILPFFKELFELGYRSSSQSNLLEKARPIGLRAEQAMFDVTGGINCYKGIIFLIGLITISFGRVLRRNEPIAMIFSNIETIAFEIMDDFKQKDGSFGIQAYHEHGIEGIRGEAKRGLPSVRKAYELIRNERVLTTQHLRLLLKELIIMADDTVLLKRSKTLENYYGIKEQMKNLDTRERSEVEAFTEKAIEMNLSFGGAADLMVATIFIHLIAKRLF